MLMLCGWRRCACSNLSRCTATEVAKFLSGYRGRTGDVLRSRASSFWILQIVYVQKKTIAHQRMHSDGDAHRTPGPRTSATHRPPCTEHRAPRTESYAARAPSSSGRSPGLTICVMSLVRDATALHDRAAPVALLVHMHQISRLQLSGPVGGRQDLSPGHHQ